MMGALRILAMCIATTVVPAMIGRVFLTVKEKGERLIFCWVSGQMALWTLFLCVCVPMVLLRSTFDRVLMVYGVGAVALLVFSLLVTAVRKVAKRPGGDTGERTVGCRQQAAGADTLARNREPGDMERKVGMPRSGKVLWGLFSALVLVQLFLLCFLAYEEGDDAYYVAITTASKDSDALYQKDPYTGNYVILDSRHALAPMPVWVSVIAKVGDISGATAAHVAVPILLILMAYGIFYLLGERLLQGDGTKLSVYMLFMALLVTFGGYSLYSSENFLLVRTSQGKAIMANLVIPFLIYLLVLVLERLERGERTGAAVWILMGMVMASGCLCSTLGSLLLCILLGVSGVCGAVAYRRWKLLLPVALCMVLPAAIAVIYMIL